jgi:hypothetical protein
MIKVRRRTLTGAALSFHAAIKDVDESKTAGAGAFSTARDAR